MQISLQEYEPDACLKSRASRIVSAQLLMYSTLARFCCCHGSLDASWSSRRRQPVPATKAIVMQLSVPADGYPINLQASTANMRLTKRCSFAYCCGDRQPMWPTDTEQKRASRKVQRAHVFHSGLLNYILADFDGSSHSTPNGPPYTKPMPMPTGAYSICLVSVPMMEMILSTTPNRKMASR